jgi:hypothetical protein
MLIHRSINLDHPLIFDIKVQFIYKDNPYLNILEILLSKSDMLIQN